MAGITSTKFPRNEPTWVDYAESQGIDNPRSASLHDYILPSGSKVGDVGFALLRVIRKKRRSPFDPKKRSRTKPDWISRQIYYDQAKLDLAPIQPRAKYLNQLENNPHGSLFGSRALELGGYHHVLRSQQRTRKSKFPGVHGTPVDFSPMITRAQACAARPSQAAVDSARIQSFKLHSNLDLYPPPPQPPETPTRQTGTGVQSSGSMDIDDGSGKQTHLTHTTSSESAGEHISPISGVEAEQDGPAPSEQETVIAGIAITRITTEIFEQFSDVSWVPTQQPFTIKDEKGKSFTAMVDGLVVVTDSTFTGITMEMKKSNRHHGGNNTAFLAQESCEMAAVIHEMPDDRIDKIRNSGRTAKQVTVAINKNEYWFAVLEYNADWADYIQGNSQAPFTLASVTEHGPFRVDNRRHMDVFTTYIQSLTYAALRDDLDGFDDDVVMAD